MADGQPADHGSTQHFSQANGATNHTLQPQVATSGGAYVAGSVHTGGGQFVGRDNIVLGAGASLTMHYYSITLRARLRKAFDTLLDNRTALFGGRQPILRKIATFIEQPQGGYLVITAPAGFGKTALTATVVRSNESAFAYHFFTPLLADGLTEFFFLQNVVDQMAQWHGHSEGIPDRLADLRALYHHFIDRPLDRTRVLVLDGLDEVTQWNLAQYLGRRLPPGLKLILTVRDVGQNWAAEYGLPMSQVEHLAMGGLDRDDIIDALRAGGAQTAAYASDPEVANEIVRVAAYEANQQLGADPLYVRLLVEDLESGKLTLQTIRKQPSGLNAYLDAWWSEVQRLAGANPAQDLLGTLAVALGPMQRGELEAINPSLVGSWATGFRQVLTQVRRFVTEDETHRYSLAHPRLREYMERQPETRPYLAKILAYCAVWHNTRSVYALAYYIQHLQAAGQFDTLFGVVLDPRFREAQQAVLGDRGATLSDLRAALDIALARNDVVRILACAGAYRESSNSRHITETIFKALDDNDWKRAFKLANLHPVTPDWSRLLWLYVAFTAAEARQPLVTTEAVQRAGQMPSAHDSVFFDRVLVRIAQSLASMPGTSRDVYDWLHEWEPARAPEQLLDTAVPLPMPDLGRQQQLLDELDSHFGYYSSDATRQAELPMYASEFYAAEMAAEPFANEEHAGYLAHRLSEILMELAPASAGADRIRGTLAAMLLNPYPRYRDIGLKAIANAVVALPHTNVFRQSLRSILTAALEREGVIFTFDLPAVLLAEAVRRQQTSPQLINYLQQAEAYSDRWGTALRVQSAKAAALFRIGRIDQAFDQLRIASEQPGGFAGYLAVALLALADRCFEFGHPEAIHEPVWGRNHNVSLLHGAYELAHNVRDPAFRDQRITLVRTYDAWIEADIYDVRAALADVVAELDEDVRNTRIGYMSARWAWPPTDPQWDGLKALVPLALPHGTTLDAVLARLVGLRLAHLSNQELHAAINICWTQLATAQPWEHRQWH